MVKFKIELLSRLTEPRKSRFCTYPTLPYQDESDVVSKPTNSALLQKGLEFEQFVVQLFDREYFQLLEWRSDKSINGISPFMSRFPDLEFYFKLKPESFHFAVECKWKEYFYKDCFEIDPQKLNNYREYETVTQIPVFLVLGIGNKPGHPSEIYSVPLQEIKEPKLHSMTLKPYLRPNPYNQFFLDCKKYILR